VENENENKLLAGALRLVSYILVAAAASAMTFFFAFPKQEGRSKLEQLQSVLTDYFVGQTDETAMEDAAASAMIDSLGDRWSYYIPAAEMASYTEQKKNSYVGIGITIQVREDELGFDVVQVEPEGPARAAGIEPGDVVIAVEGQNAAQLGTAGARDVIRGEAGTTVQVTVLRDGRELTFTVERQKILVTVASGTMLEDGIGLIKITNFDDRCAQETIARIEELRSQGARKLIFDVRFNPGGYKHELVQLLNYLLPEGVLFRSVDYAGNESVDESDADHLKLPMAVLVNGDSYSAAEFFAAALREYGWATVVGEPTVGKSYFQQTFTFSDGSGAGVSVGKYLTPKGVSLADEGGLVPDVTVTVDDETAAAIYSDMVEPGEDPQILAAVEALKKEK